MAGLTGEERARASRFVTDELTARWACARATLRRILAARLDAPPCGLRFDVNAYGKPFLVPERQPPLHFNLSHSGGVAGLALSGHGPLGFDIEVRGEAPLEVAKDVFSDAERGALRRHSPAERPDAFYRGWTRKEAFIKAVGSGLSHPLKSFDVTLDREAPRLTRIEDERAEDWVLVSMEPDAGGWFAAIAMQTGGRALDIRIHDAAAVWDGPDKGRD